MEIHVEIRNFPLPCYFTGVYLPNSWKLQGETGSLPKSLPKKWWAWNTERWRCYLSVWTNISPEKWWLEDDPFLLKWSLSSCKITSLSIGDLSTQIVAIFQCHVSSWKGKACGVGHCNNHSLFVHRYVLICVKTLPGKGHNVGMIATALSVVWHCRNQYINQCFLHMKQCGNS